jgi:acyl carrier protein
MTEVASKMTEIGSKISAFITDNLLLGRSVDVAGSPSFLEAGIIDSTGVLELVQFLEETWGFSVRDEEMVPDNLDSLAKLESFVGKKLGE